jgi:multiple sugar transport system permease protein
MAKRRSALLYNFANNEKHLSYLFILPAVVILFGVAIFPLIFSLSTSLTNFTFALPRVEFIGLKNFAKIFKDDYFWNGLKLTAIFVAASTTVSLIVGFAIALLIDRLLKGAAIIKTIVLFPMVVPSIVVGIMWLLMFMPDFSVINYFLEMLGINPPQWILTPGWALVAVLIAYIWQWTPFFILMITAGLAALPIEPYEAAVVDGASWIQMVRFITVPLLRPIILLTIVIRMMDAFRVFDQVFVMTAGGPGRSTQVLSLVIYLSGIRYRYLGYASAMSWIMLIIIIVLATLMIRLLRQVRV